MAQASSPAVAGAANDLYNAALKLRGVKLTISDMREYISPALGIFAERVVQATTQPIVVLTDDDVQDNRLEGE